MKDETETSRLDKIENLLSRNLECQLEILYRTKNFINNNDLKIAILELKADIFKELRK